MIFPPLSNISIEISFFYTKQVAILFPFQRCNGIYFIVYTFFLLMVSSVSSMLDHLQVESLESRRSKIQLTLFYKVVCDLVDIPSSACLTRSTARTRSSHTKKFRRVSPSTECFKSSFFPQKVPLWNSLPATVAKAHSFVSFKEELSTLSF